MSNKKDKSDNKPLITASPGYVLVTPIEEPKEKEGIYIPPKSNRQPQKGEVLDIGQSTDESGPIPCQKGDTVIFRQWAGTEIKIDKKKYHFMKFTDIVGVIKE